ncbi:MAG: RraA family protein [Alphaproteobacteria bacterium]|nr:RraA family protein [Alphaproteobacteria bacterium]
MSTRMLGQPGFCIVPDFDRPPGAEIEKLGRFAVSLIGDGLGRRAIMDAAIRPINPARRLCGPAFTVETRGADNLMLHAALALAKPGDVIVCDAHGDLSAAVWGGLMGASAVKLGLGGLVIDGAVRDREELYQMELPVFARGVTPCGPHKDGPGQINLPIACGGVPVHPGDVVVGDGDGIIVVPKADLAMAIAAAAQRDAGEARRRVEIERGEITQPWLEAALRAKGVLKAGETL